MAFTTGPGALHLAIDLGAGSGRAFLVLARAVQPRRFEPRERPAWREAAARYREIEGRYS